MPSSISISAAGSPPLLKGPSTTTNPPPVNDKRADHHTSLPQPAASTPPSCRLPHATPPELRTRIYDFVFALDIPTERVELKDAVPPSHALVLSCRQIRAETRHMYRAACAPSGPRRASSSPWRRRRSGTSTSTSSRHCAMTTSPTSGRSRSITREECLVPTTFTDGLWHDDHAKVLLCAPVHDAELRGAGFEVLRDRDPLRKGWSTVVFDRHDVNEANAARGIKSDSKLSKTELLEMMAILARAVGRAGVRRP